MWLWFGGYRLSTLTTGTSLGSLVRSWVWGLRVGFRGSGKLNKLLSLYSSWLFLRGHGWLSGCAAISYRAGPMCLALQESLSLILPMDKPSSGWSLKFATIMLFFLLLLLLLQRQQSRSGFLSENAPDPELGFHKPRWTFTKSVSSSNSHDMQTSKVSCGMFIYDYLGGTAGAQI